MAQKFADFITSKSSKSPHYLVVGHPISHSLSPLMHNLSLDYVGINSTYYAIDLHPNDLPTFSAWCNRDEFLGCNITIPYKQQLMEVVDSKHSLAHEVGAINTIVKEENKLVGYNTDVYGFLEPIKQYTDELEGTDAIIFGTGGASKAVSVALRTIGFEQIYFVSRSPERFTKLNESESYINYNQWSAYLDNVSMVINTTPLGMLPNTNKSPVRDGEEYLLKDKICFDIVYNPIQTKFLQQAENHALVTINGLDMLIYQGSKSFELWTGHSFPFQQIKDRLMEEFRLNA